jgi:hypothetical protein
LERSWFQPLFAARERNAKQRIANAKVVHTKVVDVEAGIAAGPRPHGWNQHARRGGQSMAREPDNLMVKRLEEGV